MPHFSSCCPGADEYVCQKCGRIKCSGCESPEWEYILTNELGIDIHGNVCPSCVKAANRINGLPLKPMWKNA
jgi:hypothetical protein